MVEVRVVALMFVCTLLAPRYAPDPSTLKQYQADGATEIAQGGSATGADVVLSAKVENGSTTGQQSLQVEVKLSADNFTGSVTAESGAQADGSYIQVPISALAPGSYKWRARAHCT